MNQMSVLESFTLNDHENGVVDTCPSVLNQIHQKHVNIAIFNRDIGELNSEIQDLLAQNIEVKASGDIDSILERFRDVMQVENYPLLLDDVKSLLLQFKALTEANQFKVYFAKVESNMCRKFHTDLNNLRLLCTYYGPGTLWLSDDNINLTAVQQNKGNDSIVLREEDVQQVKTGSVAILKGALYPNSTDAIMHRSPTIESNNQKRLLLRIDTNAAQNLWT